MIDKLEMSARIVGVINDFHGFWARCTTDGVSYFYLPIAADEFRKPYYGDITITIKHNNTVADSTKTQL